MAEAPADNFLNAQASVHPLLRQRRLNRANTFSEGAQPPLPRRRNSTLSQHSDTRHSFRSSTDDLLRSAISNDMEKLTTSDEISIWHSAPLVFAIVPAFAGLFFQNGGAVITDILLLAFGSMFLNWCVRTPWEWYHAAQQTQYIDDDGPEYDDTIMEETEAGPGSATSETDQAESSSQPDTAPTTGRGVAAGGNVSSSGVQNEAREELRRNEITALCACFVGPLFGSYILHALRSQLSRPAEGLVSNYNLTIFVMVAELRPIHHVIKMKQARMLHLQRFVRRESTSEYRKADIQDLSNRLADLESRAADSYQSPDIESLKIGATVRQGMQPQLDALNRAVRRYEKRQAAQAMQIEARFQELDSRLRDALALAAAAARTGQRPGIVSTMLAWIASIFAYGIQFSWAIAASPYRTVASIYDRLRDYMFSTDRRPRKRTKGQTNGYGATQTSKTQLRTKDTFPSY